MEGRWAYAFDNELDEFDEKGKPIKVIRRAFIISPEGRAVLVIERTRRDVGLEARDITQMLNTTGAHLAEGVVFA